MQIDSRFRLESLVVASLLFKGLEYLARDALVLRVLVTMGIICDVFFYALQPIPILPPVISSLILIAINLGIPVIVILERTTLAMSDREKRLFAALDTLTPGQFRKLKRLGQFRTATERMEILKEGEVPTNLYHVEGPGFELRNGESSLQKSTAQPLRAKSPFSAAAKPVPRSPCRLAQTIWSGWWRTCASSAGATGLWAMR
jgi:hypothetical protein